MGLLFFSHLCNRAYVTGSEKQLLLLLREMMPDYACKLVVPDDGLIAGQARGAGIPVITLPIPIVPVIYKARPDTEAAIEAAQSGPQWRNLLQMLLRERPDAVFINTSAHPLPAAAANALGIPVVWVVSEVIESNAWTDAAAESLFRRADLIVGVSETALRPFRTSERAARTALLYPTWHREELEPDDWPNLRSRVRRELRLTDSQRLIAYISSAIYPGKGLDHYMRMAAAVAERYPEAMFLVVGTPANDDYMNACLAYVRSGDLLEHRFRFIRFEPRIAKLYPAMDIVVIPSLAEEGFGMTAAEGMAFGKAVVSYAAGGLAEIHKATGNGSLLVPVGDVEALTDKVAALLEETELQEGRFERAAAAAEAAFGIEPFRQRLALIRERLPIRRPPAYWLLRGSGKTVYAWDGEHLRPFGSDASFIASGHSFSDVRQTPDSVIAALPRGRQIGFEGQSGASRHRRGRGGGGGRGKPGHQRGTVQARSGKRPVRKPARSRAIHKKARKER